MTTSKTHTTRTLTRLRAGVLGANDGIVSTSSVVMGVAGAGVNNQTIFTAGFAALAAGALSMAVGEYVSVASQKDAEQADHTRANGDFSSPVQAAATSLVSFTLGGMIPFLAIILTPQRLKVTATIAAVLLALLCTGYLSARIGGAGKSRAIIRIIIGGMLAVAVTYYIGTLLAVTTG